MGVNKVALYLKSLSTSDGKMIYDMLQEIDENDHGFKNEARGLSYQDFARWLKRNEQFSKEVGLEEWMVPQTIFWMYHDQTPVGYGRIRHWLNEHLEERSGHLGYAVPFTHRGKGYGSELLRLLIQECSNMGINPIQVGVNSSNHPSNKLVQKNGGVLHKVTETKNLYLIH